MSWRDEVLTQCSGSQHPSSLPIKGAGRARLSAPTAPWCHALVAMGIVCHHSLSSAISLPLLSLSLSFSLSSSIFLLFSLTLSPRFLSVSRPPPSSSSSLSIPSSLSHTCTCVHKSRRRGRFLLVSSPFSPPQREASLPIPSFLLSLTPPLLSLFSLHALYARVRGRKFSPPLSPSLSRRLSLSFSFSLS